MKRKTVKRKTEKKNIYVHYFSNIGMKFNAQKGHKAITSDIKSLLEIFLGLIPSLLCVRAFFVVVGINKIVACFYLGA